MNYINSYKSKMRTSSKSPTAFSWSEIDKVFLDLDGTLLDSYFDDYFWEEFVVDVYSQKHKVSLEETRRKLIATYKSVESTLCWTDLDYWSEKLELDIAGLKHEVRHLIQLRPYVIEFLTHLKDLGKAIYLVTNAHPKTLEIKMAQVDLLPWFQLTICSQDIGAAKEQLKFWEQLEEVVPHDKKRTLFIDDTVKVLDTASSAGFKHLVHIAEPSSNKAAEYCDKYQSICSFQPLL